MLLVALAVLLPEMVEDLVEPWRRIWEEVEVVVLDVSLEPMLVVPKIVVDPRVVVRVVDPLVIVEMISEVVIGEDEATVMVELYEMYGPVGIVASDVPLKVRIPPSEVDSDVCANAAAANILARGNMRE